MDSWVTQQVNLLNHADARERLRAVRALASEPGLAEPAVPALVGRLTDPDPVVRREAAGALKGVGRLQAKRLEPGPVTLALKSAALGVLYVLQFLWALLLLLGLLAKCLLEFGGH